MHQSPSLRASQGFTLIEILIGVAVLGILAMILIPLATCQIRRAQIASIFEDLRAAKGQVEIFELEHGRWPVSLEEAYEGMAPPKTVYYCTDEDDGNSGHGNETCAFFDPGNPSGNNNHGGVPGAGYMMRTEYGLAECANIDFAWST